MSILLVFYTRKKLAAILRGETGPMNGSLNGEFSDTEPEDDVEEEEKEEEQPEPVVTITPKDRTSTRSKASSSSQKSTRSSARTPRSLLQSPFH